jgi:RNA-binding protein PNO1
MEREPIKKQANQMVEDGDDDDNIMVENFDKPDDHEINIDEIAKPSDLSGGSPDFRRISVPQHRMTPLRNNWETIVKTIVDRLKLQVRMNTKKKCVEIKSAAETPDKMNIQRAADFIKAFVLGFNLSDAIAMLRLDDLYLETFEIRDGKNIDLT